MLDSLEVQILYPADGGEGLAQGLHRDLESERSAEQTASR